VIRRQIACQAVHLFIVDIKPCFPVSIEVRAFLLLKSFGLFEGRERGVSSRSVLIIRVYNPTPVAPLIDGDFRRFPDRELPGHENATTDFWALNRSKSRENCCTENFLLCSGGT
jgi:hypothetical protein